MPPKKKDKKEKEYFCGSGQTFFVGREVKKAFKGFDGKFTGRVVDFHSFTGYRIEYEDGDAEDLSEEALLKLLADESGSNSDAPLAQFELASTMSKRQAPPATSLAQCWSIAHGAARRKRKHTELKRSGMFERKRQEAEALAAAAAKAAAASARLPLHPPPEWAIGMQRDAQVIRLDGAPDVQPILHDHDISLFRKRATPHAISLSLSLSLSLSCTICSYRVCALFSLSTHTHTHTQASASKT